MYLAKIVDFYESPERQSMIHEFRKMKIQFQKAREFRLMNEEEWKACDWRINQLMNVTSENYNKEEQTSELSMLKKYLQSKKNEEQDRIESRLEQLKKQLSGMKNPDSQMSSPDAEIDDDLASDANDNEWILDLK